MIFYALKTGFNNLGAKKLFTFASIITISCAVLVFCIFFVLASNLNVIMGNVENSIGIQVFFDDGLSEDEIKNIAKENFYTPDVMSIKFKSSNEAWEEFKVDYFGNNPELVAAFENDNPLANSSSFEIILNDISKQYDYVNFIKNIEGVRQVNYSNVLIDALSSLSIGISTFSLILIILLLLIATILISNTISLSSQFRKKENEIMKLIGATNYMIRAPFVIEGFLIGLIGSVIPIFIICCLYNYTMNLIMENIKFISNIFEPILLVDIAIPIIIISLVFSSAICMFISFLTIRKHLKV